ncbi:methyl-accepting chemotaxis protein, partial [Rhodovulum visakhapatnamense]
MLKFVSTVFGSIALKFSSALVLMGAMTAAAIVISTMVFDSLSGQIDRLVSEDLPGIRDSVAVIEHTGDVRDSLSEMLMARNAEGVETGFQNYLEESKHVLASVNDLPAEDRKTFLPMLVALSDKAQQMRRALDQRFASQNLLQDQLAEFGARVGEIREALSIMTEDAVYDMNLAGDQTIESVSDTLDTLVHSDFNSTALILQARAEINLLSGVALALARQDDPALAAILRDLATASLRKLEGLLADLDTAGTIPDYLPILTETRAAFAGSANAGFRARAGYTEEVMRLRDASNIALSSAIDDLTFKLMIGAEDTAVFNREAIHRLLSNEVQQIRDTSDVDLAVETLVASAYLGATAKDAAEADAAQDQILAARDALTDLAGRVYLTSSLKTMIEGIVAFADPETGVVANRRAWLAAQQEAEDASRAAYERLRGIASVASDQGNNAIAMAGDIGTAILAEAGEAKHRLKLVTLGSVAVFITAPILTWLLIIWPMRRLVRVTGRLARGELAEVKGFGIFGGEIARMAESLVVFREGLIERDRMQQAERAAEEDRQASAAAQQAVVSKLASALQALSGGDLTSRIDERFAEDYERLRSDFNATVDTLNDLIGSVVENATEIHARAEEISGASDNL